MSRSTNFEALQSWMHRAGSLEGIFSSVVKTAIQLPDRTFHYFRASKSVVGFLLIVQLWNYEKDGRVGCATAKAFGEWIGLRIPILLASFLRFQICLGCTGKFPGIKRTQKIRRKNRLLWSPTVPTNSFRPSKFTEPRFWTIYNQRTFTFWSSAIPKRSVRNKCRNCDKFDNSRFLETLPQAVDRIQNSIQFGFQCRKLFPFPFQIHSICPT